MDSDVSNDSTPWRVGLPTLATPAPALDSSFRAYVAPGRQLTRCETVQPLNLGYVAFGRQLTPRDQVQPRVGFANFYRKQGGRRQAIDA